MTGFNIQRLKGLGFTKSIWVPACRTNSASNDVHGLDGVVHVPSVSVLVEARSCSQPLHPTMTSDKIVHVVEIRNGV